MSSPINPAPGTPEDWLRHANKMAEQVIVWAETILNPPPPTLPGIKSK